MRIKSIEITSFGKFKNKNIEFNEGFNVIFGNNESGKSTIISFIYAMLYGFGDNRGKGISMREKYTPWDGGECEGKLHLITDDNIPVTIYRKAGSVKKYDILKVYNTDTAEPLPLNPEEISEVNSDTFLKTLCIRQLSSTFEGGSSEIVTRLANIATSGDESASYEKALKIIDTVRKEIRPLRGNGGTLSALNGEISALERANAEQKETKISLDKYISELSYTEKAVKKAEDEYETALTTNFDAQIANLKGRITEKEAFLEKSSEEKSSPKKIFLLAAILLAVFAVIMLITKAYFWFAPLIAAVAVGALSFLEKKPVANTEEIENLEMLKNELSSLEKERALHENKISMLKTNTVSARKRLEELNFKITTLKSRMVFADTSALPSLYKKREKLEADYSMLSKVLTALESSHSKMQKNFTPQVNKKASEYFEKLTDGKYSKVFCDEEFNLRIEADMPRESAFFSGGTVDQLYLSLRLALIDMLFKDSSTFIILDQPFLQYDADRTQKAINLLENLTDNRQILFFTADEKEFSGNKNTETLT